VPAQWVPASGAAVEPEPDVTLTEVERDGTTWRLGTAAELAWIAAGTTVGTAITAAIPAVFDAYVTILLPEETAEQVRHDRALISALRAQSTDERWWLGYLDTGADDVVFSNAPRVRLYADWPYVVVQAGPEQASGWRRWELGSFWSGHLPNLMFPVDRCWLVSTLWDDDWTCVGGPSTLIERLLSDPELGPRTRRVDCNQDATPPGHTAI
jgi:hypothetical protein